MKTCNIQFLIGKVEVTANSLIERLTGITETPKEKTLKKAHKRLPSSNGCQPVSATYLIHFTAEVNLINRVLYWREENRKNHIIDRKRQKKLKEDFKLDKNIMGDKKGENIS